MRREQFEHTVRAAGADLRATLSESKEVFDLARKFKLVGCKLGTF